MIGFCAEYNVGVLVDLIVAEKHAKEDYEESVAHVGYSE